MNKKIRNIGLLIFFGGLILYLGSFLFSVTDSPDIFVCEDNYGDASNRFSYNTGSIFGYYVHETTNSVSINYENKIYKLEFPRSTPANPACGVITLPDGSKKKITSYTCQGDYSNWDEVMWSAGQLTNNSADSDLQVRYCYEAYGYLQWRCAFKVDVPKGLINLKFDSTKLATFVGQDVKIPLIITNDWTRPITGYLDLEYMVETPFGNSTKTERIESVTYNPGETEVIVTIPTGNVAEFMWFRGLITTEITNFTGFSSGCNPTVAPLTSIGVKTFDTDWQRIVVNPKPLYLEVPTSGNCDSLSGYELNEDNTFCIREDIADLGCMQIGCPVFENMTNEYLCTSTGICAETVYKYGCINDSDCEDFGAVCMESAFSEEENFCVKTEIQEIIKEVPQPIYVQNTCADINYCADGYTCMDEVLDDGTPMAVCIKDNKISNLAKIIIGIIILIIIISIVTLIIKKR